MGGLVRGVTSIMPNELNARTEEEARLQDLMRRYQAGQLDAFERLYTELSPGLGQYLTSLARDSARRSDLLQDTFLQIHRSRHTYDPALPVRPWAFAVARHVWLMSERSRRRRNVHEAPAEVDLPDLPVPPEIEGWVSRDHLGRALGHVTSDRREALMLHHLFGLSFREIGALLGIREGAAKIRASRGMAELRQVLAHQGGVHA